MANTSIAIKTRCAAGGTRSPKRYGVRLLDENPVSIMSAWNFTLNIDERKLENQIEGP